MAKPTQQDAAKAKAQAEAAAAKQRIAAEEAKSQARRESMARLAAEGSAPASGKAEVAVAGKTGGARSMFSSNAPAGSAVHVRSSNTLEAYRQKLTARRS